MKTIDLFSGTGSFSKVALERGHEIATYDNCPSASTLVPLTHRRVDLLDERVRFPQGADIIWASPPCQGFSVAVIGRNWHSEGSRRPKTDSARIGLRLLLRTLAIIEKANPKWWFIENPRGMMRVKMDAALSLYGLEGQRHTVTYCQYEEDLPLEQRRMKATDIWTNNPDWSPKPPCRNGDPCHASAPRGSRTGTQGIKGARDRSRIPADIFREIFDAIGQ